MSVIRLISKMSTTKTLGVLLAVRVPSDLAAELRLLAQREDRSVSGEVRRALAEHVRGKSLDERRPAA